MIFFLSLQNQLNDDEDEVSQTEDQIHVKITKTYLQEIEVM